MLDANPVSYTFLKGEHANTAAARSTTDDATGSIPPFDPSEETSP